MNAGETKFDRDCVFDNFKVGQELDDMFADLKHSAWRTSTVDLHRRTAAEIAYFTSAWHSCKLGQTRKSMSTGRVDTGK